MVIIPENIYTQVIVYRLSRLHLEIYMYLQVHICMKLQLMKKGS